MEQQDGDDALAGRVLGIHQAHQRRPGQVQAQVPGIEARLQLLQDLALGGVRLHLLHLHPCLAPDHLQRLLQAFPEHRGAQDVVALDHPLQGCGEIIQRCRLAKANCDCSR